MRGDYSYSDREYRRRRGSLLLKCLIALLMLIIIALASLLIYEIRFRDYQNPWAQAQAEKEAQEAAARIREEAEIAARKRLPDIQVEIEDRTTAGRQQFEFVQDELNNALELFSKLQKQFMQSYKSIQEIVRDHPGPDLDEDVPAGTASAEQEADSGE